MSSDRLIGPRLSRRRFAAMTAAIPAAALLPFGLREAGAQDAVVVSMVTDTNGLGDQNFNDLADRGGKEAATDFGIQWKVLESNDAASYVPNLTAGAEQGALTVAVGYLLTDAVNEVAPQFADKQFLIIDSVADQPNVRSVTYAENEPAFLVGVVAGKTTKTNKIGIVGGQDIPPVEHYEVGFVAGIRSVNPTAADQISIVYADTFSDPPKGKELALAQFEQGCDIVFPIAGATGTGAYQAVSEQPEGVWVIGADTTQDHLAPGRELVTAQKGVDFAVFQACKDISTGSYTDGAINYTLKSGGVSLQSIPGRVPEALLALARGYEKLIIDGTLKVPATRDELKTFVPPEEPAPIEASPVASSTA